MSDRFHGKKIFFADKAASVMFLLYICQKSTNAQKRNGKEANFHGRNPAKIGGRAVAGFQQEYEDATAEVTKLDGQEKLFWNQLTGSRFVRKAMIKKGSGL